MNGESSGNYPRGKVTSIVGTFLFRLLFLQRERASFQPLKILFFLPVPHTFSLFCDEIYAKDQDACGKTFLFLLLFRIKMSQNIRNILGELPPYEKKVVYDLDQLIRNKNAGEEINSKLAYYCAL